MRRTKNQLKYIHGNSLGDKTAKSRKANHPYCLFAWINIRYCIFVFYVLIGVLLKGMVESSLLSKDGLLTPDIDGVMSL